MKRIKGTVKVDSIHTNKNTQDYMRAFMSISGLAINKEVKKDKEYARISDIVGTRVILYKKEKLEVKIEPRANNYNEWNIEINIEDKNSNIISIIYGKSIEFIYPVFNTIIDRIANLMPEIIINFTEKERKAETEVWSILNK